MWGCLAHIITITTAHATLKDHFILCISMSCETQPCACARATNDKCKQACIIDLDVSNTITEAIASGINAWPLFTETDMDSPLHTHRLKAHHRRIISSDKEGSYGRSDEANTPSGSGTLEMQSSSSGMVKGNIDSDRHKGNKLRVPVEKPTGEHSGHGSTKTSRTRMVQSILSSQIPEKRPTR